MAENQILHCDLLHLCFITQSYSPNFYHFVKIKELPNWKLDRQLLTDKNELWGCIYKHTDTDVYVVAFRGSMGLKEWMINLRVDRKQNYYDIYKNILSNFDISYLSEKNIVIAGVSAGALLAGLFAKDLCCDALVTFGSPCDTYPGHGTHYKMINDPVCWLGWIFHDTKFSIIENITSPFKVMFLSLFPHLFNYKNNTVYLLPTEHYGGLNYIMGHFMPGYYERCKQLSHGKVHNSDPFIWKEYIYLYILMEHLKTIADIISENVIVRRNSELYGAISALKDFLQSSCRCLEGDINCKDIASCNNKEILIDINPIFEVFLKMRDVSPYMTKVYSLTQKIDDQISEDDREKNNMKIVQISCAYLSHNQNENINDAIFTLCVLDTVVKNYNDRIKPFILSIKDITFYNCEQYNVAIKEIFGENVVDIFRRYNSIIEDV